MNKDDRFALIQRFSVSPERIVVKSSKDFRIWILSFDFDRPTKLEVFDLENNRSWSLPLES
jgi:hypothetical protein